MTVHEDAVVELVQHRRSLLVTAIGVGSRQVAVTAAAEIAEREGIPVQIIDSLAMHPVWFTHFMAAKFDPRHVVTPQWVVRHMMLPIDASDCLTVVYLDNIGQGQSKSHRRIRDYLGDYRVRWESNPPRLLAVVHEAQMLKHLPLISHLFPVDHSGIVNMTDLPGHQIDLRRYRDAYVKATRHGPWWTETPGRALLAKRWAESEKKEVTKS
jgi:hypothetical protein